MVRAQEHMAPSTG